MKERLIVLAGKLDRIFFLVLLPLIGLIIMGTYLADFSYVKDFDIMIFALLLAIANILTVVFPKSGVYLSLSLPVILCVILVKGPAAAMWVAVLGISLFVYRLGVLRLLYNLCEIAIAIYMTNLLIPSNFTDMVIIRDWAWVLLGAFTGDFINVFLVVKFVTFQKGDKFFCTFVDIWFKKMKVIRPLFYTIGILMTIAYQAQGSMAAVLAFSPVIALFYLMDAQIELDRKNVLAKTDDLTKAGNRYALSNWWEQEFPGMLRQGGRLCVLMIDIDDFKVINDSYGHCTGDRVLKEVSLAITNSLRQSDRIFRYGGEEFVVVLPGVDLQVADEVARRICANVSQLELAELVGRPITVSIGISVLTDELVKEKDASNELIRRSDIAMYLAKRNGKNQVCVFS